MNAAQSSGSAAAHKPQSSNDSQFDSQYDSQCESAVERVARRTALEHAIRSTDPVIEGHETHEEWLAHRETVVNELCPVGALETAYAQQAASYLWRLDRVIRYEVTATQFDLEDLIQEFIVSLDHPDLPRDRSESVTLEKIRGPLSDFLKQFAKWGEAAVKLPGQKEGTAAVREEVKRIKERRILPDQPTVQTIIKYESHLKRCLAGTMTELRRLQKERRQGLRKVIEGFTDRRVDDAGDKPADDAVGKPVLADFTAPDPSNETNHEHAVEDKAGSPVLADAAAPEPSNEAIHEHIVGDSVGSPEPADLMNPEHVDEIEVESPERVESVDRPIPKPTSNDFRISEATPNGIVTHQKNASGVLITMFPKTHYSAVPNVIVRGGPIARESPTH